MQIANKTELNFKEKLIIALASNSSMIIKREYSHADIPSPEDSAKRILRWADAIIEELEKQNEIASRDNYRT